MEFQICDLETRVKDRDALIRAKDNELLETHRMFQEKEEEFNRSLEEVRGSKKKADSLVRREFFNIGRTSFLLKISCVKQNVSRIFLGASPSQQSSED